MDLTQLSTGIHKVKNDYVERNDYTFTLINYLKENKIVFLEGDQDSGKTTICENFCFENKANTISIFFNPLNRIDYQLDYYLNNAISQLRIYLGENYEDVISDENLGLENYQKLLFKVRKKLKNNILYFIIDGLEQLSEENIKLLKKIVDILPLGDENIHVVLTGNQKEIIKKIDSLNKVETRSVSVMGFSESQVIDFFAFDNVTITKEDVKNLLKITNGYPGRLKVCKKLISKLSVDEIIEKEFKKLIELECEKVNLEINEVNILFSIISLKDDAFSIYEISKILEIDEEQLKKLVETFDVLEIRDNIIYFQSINYKLYFKNLLRANIKVVDDLLINFLSSSDTINSKFQLSEIYAENKQWVNLIGVIDESFLANAINTTESLNRVNNSINLAYNASLESKNSSELFKYSVQGSIINELENISNLESEILARISIKDFSGAISIAESTLLKVNRLKLLSLVARKEKELNGKVDEDLIKVINNLYKTTDFTDAGDKLYDIVANLMYVIPHLALEIIENSSSESSENNMNDWIVAKLSIASIKSESNSSNENKDANNKLVEKLENNNARKISKAISFLVGNYDSKKVLDEVKKISDSKERLRLLRIWLSNNKQSSENIELVIEKALDELISSSSNSILSLEVLKDITLQLPYIKKIAERERIYKRFVKLDTDIKDLGLDKDKFVYELNIFHTLFSISRDKSIVKLGNIINNAKKLKIL